MTEKTTELQPIVFMNGDGGVGVVAPIVLEKIFPGFPTIDVPLTVEDRIRTNDDCINVAVQEVLNVGSGFKNSTASADPKIKNTGKKSANIILRPKLGAYGILRLLEYSIRYQKICGTLRYAHGGFYDEIHCQIKNFGGKEIAIIQQRMDISDLKDFAELAFQISQEKELELILSSKSTIATSEKLFRERVEVVWKELGVDWKHKLTDIALAELPVETALNGSRSGGFLHVADNVTGDNSSDIIDHQNGDFTMGSVVYCKKKNGKKFSYHELPGGTCDDYLKGTLPGRNFLNPAPIIFGLCNAFESVNPDQKSFFDQIKKTTIYYLKTTQFAERETLEMIDFISAEIPKTATIIA